MSFSIVSVGDYVKKKLIVYGITVSLGIILAFIFYYKIDESFASVIENKTITVFQLGVYRDKDNATNLINELNMGYLFYDGTYYRVYAGLTIDNIPLNEAYLNNKHVTYYEKDIKVTKTFYNLVKEYDSLTTNEETLEYTNKNLIEAYLETIN